MASPRRGPYRTSQTDLDGIEMADLRSGNISNKFSSTTMDENKRQATAASFSDILQFMQRSHIPLLVTGGLAAVLTGIFGPAVALLTGKVFEVLSEYAGGTVSDDQLVDKISTYAKYLAGIGAASFVAHALFFSSWVAFGELQAKSARGQLFTALLNQEIAWFDRRKAGPSALIPRMNAQIKDLQLAASQPLGAIISIIANACFAMGLAFYFSWKLTLVIMASIPVVILSSVITNGPMALRGFMQQKAKSDALKSISNALTAIDAVKCNNAQQYERHRYVQKTKDIAFWYNKTVNINAIQQGFAAALAGLMFVQAFYYGGVLVRSGEKNPGDVVTTFASALSVFTSLNSINQQMLIIELGRAAGGRMKAIMAEVRGHTNRISKAIISGSVQHIEGDDLQQGMLVFQDVKFRYPARPDQMALKGLNMEMMLGQLNFIVGTSGSGKSTIGQLLTRLYEPESGYIKIADVNIKNMTVKQLRQTINLVEQHSVLFDTTIRENIELGRLEPSHILDDIGPAIDFSMLRKTVLDMPEDSKTPVGLYGKALSGGERQRVALARAYLRDAPILILDESTSALDSPNRRLIMDAIRYWRQGKTTIMITHDMELIKDDDYVYFISEGKLQREGYKVEMRDVNGPYPPTSPTSPTFPINPTSPTSPTSAYSACISLTSTVTPGPYASRKQNFDDEDVIEDYLNTSFAQKPGKASRPWSSYLYAPRARNSMMYTQPMAQFQSLPQSPESEHDRNATPDLSLQPTNSRNLEQQEMEIGNTQRQTPARLGSSNQQGESFRYISMSAATRFSNIIDRAGSAMVNRAGWEAYRAREDIRNARLRRRQSIQLYEEQGNIKEPEEVQQVLPLPTILSTVWPSISRGQSSLLLLALVLCGIQAASMPVMALLSTKLIATYSFAPGSTKTALKCALGIVGVAVIDGISHYILQRSFEYVAQAWVNMRRNMAVDRILDQPKEFFAQDENAVARIVETLDRYADETRNVLGRYVSMYTMATFQIIISVAWSLATNWRLTLVTLAFSTIILGLTRIFGAASRKWEGLSNDAAEAISRVSVETFTCIKTVKLLTAESHFASLAGTANTRAAVVGTKRAAITGLLFGISEASETFAQSMIFWYAARLTSGGVPVSSIIQVLLMLITTFAQVTMILAIIPQASLARDAATRFLRLSTLPRTSHEHTGTAFASAQGPILFRSVTFAYPGTSRPVLSKASFNIPPAAFTVIVGTSGSGKSTIASLLLRLFPLAEGKGTITLAGRSLASLSTSSLRSRLALVQQTPTVLAASIAANISYGTPSTIARARIVTAAQAAGLHDFIASLPRGYETIVGEGGEGLSGGQAQRLAIARALVRKPDVLVLDEATSALDGESARGVRETLAGLVAGGGSGGRGVAVVAITHDRRMMEGADWVVVMEGGRCVEEGSFGRLMRERSALRKLVAGG